MCIYIVCMCVFFFLLYLFKLSDYLSDRIGFHREYMLQTLNWKIAWYVTGQSANNIINMADPDPALYNFKLHSLSTSNPAKWIPVKDVFNEHNEIRGLECHHSTILHFWVESSIMYKLGFPRLKHKKKLVLKNSACFFIMLLPAWLKW